MSDLNQFARCTDDFFGSLDERAVFRDVSAGNEVPCQQYRISRYRHRDLLYGSCGAGSVYDAGQIEFVKF